MNRKQFAWSIAFGLTCRLVAQTGDEEKRLRLHGEVFRLLGVKPGDSVGDIGAGDEGMWSILLSQKVGKAGLVFAEDIDLSAIEKLQKVISAKSITNVKLIVGTQSDPRLPPGQADSIIVSMTYHEFADHPEMLSNLRAALKPGGRLVIFESIGAKRRSEPRAVQTKNHEISPRIMEAELSKAGFTIVETVDPLWPDAELSRYLVAASK